MHHNFVRRDNQVFLKLEFSIFSFFTLIFLSFSVYLGIPLSVISFIFITVFKLHHLIIISPTNTKNLNTKFNEKIIRLQFEILDIRIF